MKIHIVQKDDTLWKLAEQYGVNFEELKKANSHLANPDMIMPGMKIKIPTGAVHAKHPSGEHHHGKKEEKKPEAIMHAPKMEVPKAVMPKMEVPKMEMPKMEMPKMEVPKIDEHKLRALVKEAVAEQLPGVLRSLLHHLKPEIINQIKIDLELSKTEINYHKEKPTPPPPKKEKPIPFKPEKVMPIMEAPCPPYPPSHHYMHGYPMSNVGVMPFEGMHYQDPVYSGMAPHMQQAEYPGMVPGYAGGQQPYEGMPQAFEGMPQTYAGMPQAYEAMPQTYPGVAQHPTWGGPQAGGEQQYGWWGQPHGAGYGMPYTGAGYPSQPVARQTLQNQHHQSTGFRNAAMDQTGGTQAVDVRSSTGEPMEEQIEDPMEEATVESVPKSTPKPSARHRSQSKRSKR